MNDTPKTPKQQINETRDIHPLVAIWLTKHGYSYIHEYRMPEHGQVDFFATHSDGHKLLVEAKGNGSVEGAIFQVLSYGLQMPDTRLAVAAPIVTEKSQALAEKYNVSLIVLGEEIPEYIEPVTVDSLLSDFYLKALAIIAACRSLGHAPDIGQFLNYKMFDLAAEHCFRLEAIGVTLKVGAYLVANKLEELFRVSSWSHLTSMDILAWICQDTSNGSIYELL